MSRRRKVLGPVVGGVQLGGVLLDDAAAPPRAQLSPRALAEVDAPLPAAKRRPRRRRRRRGVRIVVDDGPDEEEEDDIEDEAREKAQVDSWRNGRATTPGLRSTAAALPRVRAPLPDGGEVGRIVTRAAADRASDGMPAGGWSRWDRPYVPFGDVDRAGVDGEELVPAIIAGYEIQTRLSMALGPADHYDRGFHPTATCGVFGAAAAAGVPDSTTRSGCGG